MAAYFTIQKPKHVWFFFPWFVLRKPIPKAVGMEHCLFFLLRFENKRWYENVLETWGKWNAEGMTWPHMDN